MSFEGHCCHGWEASLPEEEKKSPIVLGSILFVLYINNLLDSVQNNSKAIMFADDRKLYARTDPSKEIFHRVGQVRNRLSEEVVMTNDVTSFKRLFDKHWKDHPCRFDQTRADPYGILAFLKITQI